MAEAVILSAIESLDKWLLKKGGLVEENLEKLYSLIVGISDLGEEKKEMAHTLLLRFKMGEYYNENKKLYDLLALNKEKMYSLVVGMADFWEDYKGKLYHFLFRVAKEGQRNKDFLYSSIYIFRMTQGETWKAKLQSLLVEIADLWGDDEGDLDKEKLHSLLFQMLDKGNYSNIKIIRRMSGEVAGLWKDKQPKLNKEKLYTWLVNKAEIEYLFDVLLYDSLYVHREIRKYVEEAKREFRMILDLITDKKLGEESSLRYFISDVVDMAHHARFLFQLQDSDPFALFTEFTEGLQGPDYGLCRKFNHIAQGLQEIKVSMLGFEVERLQNAREMEGGEYVVGLEEDVKLLLSDEGNGKTTIITGMAGIGKTTLARQVYNHTTITQQFERRAWVCLSNSLSRKEILVSLIRQVVDSKELASLDKIEWMDYKSLTQVLRQQLLERRYFIVLDDVWDNKTHLKYFMKAFRKEKGSELFLTCRKGSRLLITTRSMSRDYDGVKYHKMKSMDADNTWRLLLKTLSIDGSDKEFPKPLVKRARQILMRKCGGLPLAIKEVGRHWAQKRQSGSEWEELIESIDLSETLGELETSYNNWDQQLKSCFLHLAFFKEGATIKAKKLVQIWMVMGVVSGSSEMSESLEKLLKESIIDVIDMDKKRNIRKCCIHAVFHRLSIIKAEDELNFEILSNDGNNRPSHQPHHCAIYCNREKLMNYSSNQDKNLVSLFFYGGGYFNASPSYWKHFEQLKTLDMEDFGLNSLPDVIGTLTELRYLGLRNNYIQELPGPLSRLKKLEVLDIALNFMVVVEDIIWRMESLRHLYMSDISCLKPLRIDTLKNLETLTYITVHYWTYSALRLEMMTSLTKLGIQEVDGNTNASKLFASLAKLKYLDFLILKGFRFKSMPSLVEIGILRNLRELKLDGLITSLPSSTNFPPYIRRLSLINSCLHKDPMPILEKLFSLAYLKLQNAYTGQQMVISCNHFVSLGFLVIEELWHLTNLQIEKGAMKKLTDLEINNCPNLESLPEDYCPMNDMMMFKMKTTKKNATKIRGSSFVSKIRKVDIQPKM